MATGTEFEASQTGQKRSEPPTDEDEAGAGATSQPSAKKLKVDNDSTATTPTAKRTFNAISSAISGLLGGGGGGSPQPPSQTQSPGPAPEASPYRPAIKLKALKGTIWDPNPEQKPRLSASTNTTPKSAKSKGRGTPGSTGSPSKRKLTDSNATTPTKRSVGRPKGSKNKPRVDPNDASAVSEYDIAAVDLEATPTKPTPGPGKRLWGPSSAAASPTPKGILTPTKNRKHQSTPKSVKFDSKGGSEMFFPDLPKSTKKTPAPSAGKVPLPPLSKPAPEIVCGVCFKGRSKPPNEIILCDNCDFAVHQECYGVAKIPEGDWLCKSCSQDDALVSTAKAEAVPIVPTTPAPAADVPEIPNFETHLRSLQRVLLDRCAGRRRIDMFGLQEVQDKTRQIVEQTVVAGEGNSMLLIGSRGSGKTTLLEDVISDVSKEHGQDFHVVRLNGFIHTDDKLALKEIWRQLGKEMEVDDDLVNRTNYADTMASLLALLSHPSEILGTDDGVTSQSIIFIIDEFDMFAAHPRQTLLYNLFDVAQSRKAPIAVLGCTTRLNVVELLEKRVKSRFSHRYVYLTQPKTLPAYWQVCRQGLLVERKDAEREGIDMTLEGYDEFQNYWNTKIADIYQHRAFQELLQYHYYTSKSAAAFFNDWIQPLASLSPAYMNLEVPSIGSETTSLTPPDSRMHLLSSLSDLDLGLLIAAARLDIVAHTDTVNFAMAYDEYSSLVGRQRVQSSASGMLAVGGGVRVWGHGVAGIAWERLISLGLLVPSGLGGGRSLGHGGLEGRMWKVDVALEEIPLAVKLNAGLAKWCREL